MGSCLVCHVHRVVKCLAPDRILFAVDQPQLGTSFVTHAYPRETTQRPHRYHIGSHIAFTPSRSPSSSAVPPSPSTPPTAAMSPEEWYKSLPVVTKVYWSIAVSMTLLATLGILNPSLFYLNSELVFGKFQVRHA